ncbi:hypothetical protein ACFXO9_27890 [Nocardia tengchongensis]|uniref:hypothetical protein n=1 Tax=Nocardia tengchongensis TaxID=2055889 RepID=UPI0036B9DFBB
MSEILGADMDDYARDPLTAVGYWQNYLDRLPFEEFEAGDWNGLQTDLVSYLADILIRGFDGEWQVIADDASPRGYWYVVAVPDDQRQVRCLDPFGFVAERVGGASIDLLRMLSEAIAQLGITTILRVQARPLT